MSRQEKLNLKRPISLLDPGKEIEWPDFYKETLELKGQSLSDLVVKAREERF